MVFPSIPVYLDPPNWQQQQASHDDHFIGNGQLGQVPPLPPPHPTGGSTRPGSLTDQARFAKVPLPEPGLKCPRCESTNTKFCYYNNYSLTQPRHFCKTCRRYWTRGGALRNVPVGGGCRRNKRIKRRSGCKTPSTTVATGGGSGSPPGSIAPPPLSFMAGSGNHMGGGDQVGQSNNSAGSSGFLLGGGGGGGDEQWRCRIQQQQQLPYNLDNFGAPLPCGTLFQFQGGESMNNGLNLSRHFVNLAAGSNYDHQLSVGWPSHDVSGLFMSSNTSTTHHLNL